jgi:hypothetical protein
MVNGYSNREIQIMKNRISSLLKKSKIIPKELTNILIILKNKEIISLSNAELRLDQLHNIPYFKKYLLNSLNKSDNTKLPKNNKMALRNRIQAV